MEKKSIGSFMAALRKAMGMTQQEVADRLNVSNKTVSKWECDDGYPDITSIPAIAELFDVTSDEILRGERMEKEEVDTNKSAIKVEKQIKRLLISTITGFKNLSMVAIALVVVGFICLFTISYALYRPIIGFGVFLVFVAASVMLEIIQINLTNASLKNSDLLEDNDAVLVPFLNTMKQYSIVVFLTNAIAFLFALPFVLVRDATMVTSVISFQTYLSLFPILAGLTAIILLSLTKIVQSKMPQQTRMLNIMQCTFLSSALIIVISSNWFIRPGPTVNIYLALMVKGGFFLLVGATLVAAGWFTSKGKTKRDKFLILSAGLRNLLYGLAIFWAYSGFTSWMEINGIRNYIYTFPALITALYIVIGSTGLYYFAKYMILKYMGQG